MSILFLPYRIVLKLLFSDFHITKIYQNKIVKRPRLLSFVYELQNRLKISGKLIEHAQNEVPGKT